MHAGEFAQCQGDGQTNKCSQNEAEDDSGPCDFESRRRSQQQSGPNGPADSDHGHLAGAELVPQSSFLPLCRHSAPITETVFSTKTYSLMTFVIPAVPDFVAAAGTAP